MKRFFPCQSSVTLIWVLAGAILALGAAICCTGLPGQGKSDHLQGDIREISRGEEVELKHHLAAGKFTLFEFHADWCPPCWEVNPELERLASDSDQIAVRKINIIDWTTPVVQQHRVTELPFFLLFDTDGELLASGDEALFRARELARTAPTPEAAPTGATSM